jgi:hypothetical protein
VVTLYRNNIYVGNSRIGVATFDASASAPEEAREINRFHCKRVETAFNKIPESLMKYWCEDGYRKLN